jgi:hypothetical protein
MRLPVMAHRCAFHGLKNLRQLSDAKRKHGIPPQLTAGGGSGRPCLIIGPCSICSLDLRNHARPRCPDRGGPFLTHRYADHAWSLSRPWRRLKERWSFPIFVGLRVVDPDTSGIESNFEGASSWFVRAVIGNQPTIANARTIRRIRVPFTISSPGSTSSAPDRPPISLFAALHSHGRPVLQPA